MARFSTLIKEDLVLSYKPTKAEIRLLEVLVNPSHRLLPVSDICQLAGISRETYYRAFKKQDFTQYHNRLSFELLREQSIPLVLVGLEAAKKGSFSHWKALIDMIRFDKEVTTISSDEPLIIRFAYPKNRE